MSCTIFQRNTDLLVIYQNIINFTQETLYPSFILKKIGGLHRKCFSKQSFFPPIFSLFLKVGEVSTISNKCWFPNKSVNKLVYTRHLTLLKVVLSIAEGFRKVDFLPHFYLISKTMRCEMFQINTDLVKVYQHINNIFKQETL